MNYYYIDQQWIFVIDVHHLSEVFWASQQLSGIRSFRRNMLTQNKFLFHLVLIFFSSHFSSLPPYHCQSWTFLCLFFFPSQTHFLAFALVYLTDSPANGEYKCKVREEEVNILSFSYSLKDCIFLLFKMVLIVRYS